VAAAHAHRLEIETGESISIRNSFPGISDMSFLGAGDSDGVRSVVLANTPDADRVTWDVAAAERLGVPVINIGPWGRDYHQRLERVHEAYSFETVPELVYRVVHDLLQEEEAS
jgi:arginine utilization protein RocB